MDKIEKIREEIIEIEETIQELENDLEGKEEDIEYFENLTYAIFNYDIRFHSSIVESKEEYQNILEEIEQLEEKLLSLKNELNDLLIMESERKKYV